MLGKPVFNGSRLPLELVLNAHELLAELPHLKPLRIRAAILLAADALTEDA